MSQNTNGSSSSSSSVQRRWRFNIRPKGGLKAQNILEAPPGFSRGEVSKSAEAAVIDVSNSISQEQRVARRQKDAMGFAYSPAKNIFSTGLMLWMSGNSIQIFSIYATGNALTTPITAMLRAPTMFKRFEMEGVDLTVPLLVFYAMQLVCLAIAVWKLNGMGLLPMTAADWTNYIPIREVIESSGRLLS
jgi:ER membrane protein complex subunit 4